MLHRIAMMLQLLKSFDVHYNIFVSGDVRITEKWRKEINTPMGTYYY
jgi:hypothetical protein